jgi:hypothetical protein
MTAVRYPTAPERPIAELTAVLSRETNPQASTRVFRPNGAGGSIAAG